MKELLNWALDELEWLLAARVYTLAVPVLGRSITLR